MRPGGGSGRPGAGATGMRGRGPAGAPAGVRVAHNRAMVDSFSYDQLIASGEGRLFGPDAGRLPLPPMLMFDRVTRIDDDGGAHGLGRIEAELDIRPELWFFACHFKDDPVMPGCLGLDAMWQLIGFYLTWLRLPGRGRALGAGEIKFTGEVGTDVKLVRYEIDIKRTSLDRKSTCLNSSH